MTLVKLPMPGRPTNFDNSWAGAYCACSRYGRGYLDIFFSVVSYISRLSPLLG